MIPELWSRGIITPIPKSSTSDPRDPMSYRGITLAPTSYKLYCGVLNSRLTVKLDELNFIHDEQNGFRSNRSTIDHLSTITSIIETRKMCKLSTFAAVIDFKKAYDTVNRFLLFCKLESIGISKTTSPKFDHDKVKESKPAHELPWLYLKFNDISGLQKSLLDLKLFNVLYKKYDDDPTEENIDNLEHSYHGLGTAHLKMHKYEQLYEEIYFGHLPETVGQHLTNLGLCYFKLNNLDEAEKMSIEVKVNAIGYYTLDVAMTFMNLGVIETVRENPAGSYEYCKTALEIYENIGLPESGMEYMMCRENMVLALNTLGRMEEALTTYRPFCKCNFFFSTVNNY
ncbi:unnamed protein product [Mytilus edulis]|uniref:Reverse transcriptase domain-containing protein n=1 Tax=Mytilus edulis TaxID=6550 RepID=A0A8S3V4Q6_MYTED|nr:unnamed protein product [Mytilus edulis]